MVTKQDYLAWAKSEPLSDMAVDCENVGQDDGAADYWQRMLAAGKQAVADRKEEAQS